MINFRWSRLTRLLLVGRSQRVLPVAQRPRQQQMPPWLRVRWGLLLLSGRWGGVKGINRKGASVGFCGLVSSKCHNMIQWSPCFSLVDVMSCGCVYVAAVPSHGEPAVLPGAQDVPVRPLRPTVHRVRAHDSALPPPLPTGQERLLQADGHVWRQLARGDGV